MKRKEIKPDMEFKETNINTEENKKGCTKLQKVFHGGSATSSSSSSSSSSCSYSSPSLDSSSSSSLTSLSSSSLSSSSSSSSSLSSSCSCSSSSSSSSSLAGLTSADSLISENHEHAQEYTLIMAALKRHTRQQEEHTNQIVKLCEEMKAQEKVIQKAKNVQSELGRQYEEAKKNNESDVKLIQDEEEKLTRYLIKEIPIKLGTHTLVVKVLSYVGACKNMEDIFELMQMSSITDSEQMLEFIYEQGSAIVRRSLKNILYAGVQSTSELEDGMSEFDTLLHDLVQ